MPERGPRGDHGQHGEEGQQGPQGDVGETGAVGERGPIGDRGQLGDTGARGRTGETGQPGEAGASTRLAENVTSSFIALTLIFIVILASLGFVIRSNRHLAREGAEAHDALCLIRLNIERRIVREQAEIARKRDYIAAVKEGRRDPIVGITIADIQSGIDSDLAELAEDRRTVNDLSPLDCVPPPPPPEGGSS